METVTERPPAPDVKHDRFLIVIGIASTLFKRKFELVDDGLTVIKLVPVEKLTEPEKLVYPRVHHMPMQHTVHIGTVDELTERYRGLLMQAFSALAQESNTSAIFGEHSLRKQTECLQRNNMDRDIALNLVMDRAAYQEFIDRKHIEFGYPKPKQSAALMNILAKAVASHATFLRASALGTEADNYASGMKESEHIKRLIADLTILQDYMLAVEKGRVR